LIVLEGDRAIVGIAFVPDLVPPRQPFAVADGIQDPSWIWLRGEAPPERSGGEIGGVGIEVIQHREEGPARGFLDPFQEVAVDFGRTLATGQVSATRLLVQLDE